MIDDKYKKMFSDIDLLEQARRTLYEILTDKKTTKNVRELLRSRSSLRVIPDFQWRPYWCNHFRSGSGPVTFFILRRKHG